MLIAALSGFILAFFVPLLFKYLKKNQGLFISAVPLSLFIFFLTRIGPVLERKSLQEFYAWAPNLKINLSFYLDGLSLTFALIISGIGFLIFLYAGSYMKHEEYVDRFYIYLLVFMSSMIGLVTSANLFTIFIFWELTSISSYMLIGFKHDEEKSRDAALQALLITAGGGLAMLAGFILISISAGTMEITEILNSGEVIRNHPYYSAIVILVLIGAFTKSAQFPFHIWLPAAMAAPTPVSAYLHSATMVKAGVYLIARMNPVLGGTDLWQNILVIVGLITMLFAAFLAVQQRDIKAILAYSTVSVLGTLIMLIGINSEIAINAMIIYLIAHALYKAALFLVAGNLDHETGTRNITKLSGLKKLMPFTASAALLAGLSKMGLIPFVGFIGKEAIYEAAFHFGKFTIILFILTFIANTFIVTVGALAGIKSFWGEEKYPGEEPEEAPLQMWIAPVILGALGLIVGVFPQVFEKLALSATGNIFASTIDLKIKLWHGFNLIFLFSLLTLAAGITVFYFWKNVLKTSDSFPKPKSIFPSRIYDAAIPGLLSAAKFQTKIFQNGFLRYYIITILIFVVGLAGFTFFRFNNVDLINIDSSISIYEIFLGIMIITGSYLVVRSKSRLVSVVSLGIVGYSVAVIFLIYGAPDLAMTQFAIETLTVILFVLIIYRLPKYLQSSSTKHRIRDIVITGSAGLFIALLVLTVLSRNLQSDLKGFYAETSYVLAHGKNVVNVILVDFRALDTMGEITVLAIAAIGIFSILKLKTNKEN